MTVVMLAGMGTTNSLGEGVVVVEAAGTVLFAGEARDELADTEILDHLLQDLVATSIDLLDLDLGLLGDEIHSALALLLLESEGDTTDGFLLDSLHKMSGETSDLVSESLGLDLGDVINDSLVHVEIVGQSMQKHAQLAQLR